MAEQTDTQINFAEASAEEIQNHFAETDDAALAELFGTQHKAFQELISKEEPSLAEVQEAKALHAECKAIKSEETRRNEEAAEAAETFAELKNATFDTEETTEASEEETDEDESGDESEEAGEEGAEGAEASTETETETQAEPEAPKAAAASTRKIVAAKAKRPAVPDTPVRTFGAVALTASAGVDGFSAGEKLEGIEGLTTAVISKVKAFPEPSGFANGTAERGAPDWSDKHPIAQLEVPFEKDFIIDKSSSEDTMMKVLLHAADESRLTGDGGGTGLTAAGGWCSPSETMYDLKADETLEGILSVPEVQVRRGGIRYTVGPQFADFYANAGFIQTEAQAIAGTAKPFYQVDCPDWTDVRLDAVGVGITVPILTNAAFPELVQRFTSGTLIAHEHMINANVIGRMVTLAGAARVFTGLGAAVSDSMEALALVADQRRQSQRLSLTRTMEAALPFWVKEVFRNDLGRRMSVAAEAVTDAQIAAHFSVRNINVQYVYDWQGLVETDEVYPATVNALVYPAGTFVKGVSPVINLSGIYDKASLEVNEFTALFVEQGLLVAQVQYDADLVTLPLCAGGRTGINDLTCVVTP